MMPASFKWKIPLLLVVIGAACFFAFPLRERINLGLDLQGGMHLVLKVDTTKVPPEAAGQDVTAIALEILRNRIDQFGVREPLIQRQGTDHILIQLPGITDRERALNLVGRTAQMQFMLVSENQRLLQQALDEQEVPGHVLLEGEDGTPFLLESEGSLTGSILTDATVEVGQIGLPVVNFRLTRDGAKLFGRLTGANINRRLAIVLDDVVLSAPVIRARITDSGVIEGQFTREEAGDLAIALRAGALPAPVMVEEERTVGPTLGRDSIKAGLNSVALGGILVVIFMVLYYRLSGLVAVFALSLNLLLILGGLGYFGATLTLPGIAGMILTLGMAVDANVLIYERMREEQRTGRPMSLVVSAGYNKAFSAIFDSNVTTLIAALFLYWFGTGPIRGFATTMAIGLLASFFTALFVTRIVFDALVASKRLTRLSMSQFFGQTTFDFVGKRYLAWGLSLLFILGGMAAFVMRGSDKYGIDFSGGFLQEYRFNRPVEADSLRQTLAQHGLGDASLQRFGSDTDWLIRTADDTEGEIQQTITKTREAFQAGFADAAPEMLRVERVGPTVGPILRRKAWLAIGWSMLGILLYVAFRFRHFDFGLGGVVALVHDVIVAAGVLCFTGAEIDFLVVSALMTIAGYSVNDTIVIYDRIRENLRLHRKLKLIEIMNLSLNETLGRTILTSSVTLLTVIALYAVGGEVLKGFALTLVVGFISGVYSTIYIAISFVVMWRQMFATRG